MGASEPGKKSLELYIHIPFCIRKCLYCDFLSFPSDKEVRERYVNCLTEEIRAMGERFPAYRISSIFLGGGTPSVLEAEQTARILAAAKEAFDWEEDAEVTTEANPGTLSREKLRACRDGGINRLSLGLQSADDGQLAALGRIHSFRDFQESYSLAREEGFSNINVDLMSALPGQTADSYRKTLETVTALRPEHISAYSLIIEEGTPFFAKYGTQEQDEETDREMYHATKTILKENGYERYEISNYAKPGRECRHNLGYWTGISYLGLGLGASSYIEGERFSNETDLKTYLNLDREDFRNRLHHPERPKLTEREKMEEFMFLGLRLTRGIEEEEFFRRFGMDIQNVYGKALRRFMETGLMERSEDRRFLRLTDYGIDVSNSVLCEFLLDDEIFC